MNSSTSTEGTRECTRDGRFTKQRDLVDRDAIATVRTSLRSNFLIFEVDIVVRIRSTIFINESLVVDAELGAGGIVNRDGRQRLADQVDHAGSRTTVVIDNIHTVRIHLVRSGRISSNDEIVLGVTLRQRSDMSVGPPSFHPAVLLNTNLNILVHAVVNSSRASEERHIINQVVDRVDRVNDNSDGFNRLTTRSQAGNGNRVSTIVNFVGSHFNARTVEVK